MIGRLGGGLGLLNCRSSAINNSLRLVNCALSLPSCLLGLGQIALRRRGLGLALVPSRLDAAQVVGSLSDLRLGRHNGLTGLGGVPLGLR